jgi:hypothetical protein
VIDGVYEILNFMTRDNLFTHQLPRASDECRPALLAQHPQLVNVDATGVNKENWRKWLDEQITRFGESLQVTALEAGAHDRRNPLDELVDMVGPDRVLPVIIA